LKPNLLLITVDQMRADCLSALSHPIVETPNLDQLTREGVTFTHAFSAVPTCIPAKTAILTGLGQRSHGRVGFKDKVPWNYECTLPGELAKAGYHTQSVGKMHVYPRRTLCGFHNVLLHNGHSHINPNKDAHAEALDSYDDYLPWLRERAGSHRDLQENGLGTSDSAMTRTWHLPEELHPTNWAVTQSIEFLRRRDPRKPFFLWLSFVRPHPPLDPPPYYFDLYAHEKLPPPVVGDWADQEDPSGGGLDPAVTRGIVRSERRLQRAMAAYYALITHIDQQIGRFRKAMSDYGVDKDTIILFASDHGDMLGDHHMFKKTVPYEGSVHIPFILADPGNRLGIKRSGMDDHPIELRDIMPTFLDAAGVAVPSAVEGKSLLPLARREDAEWRTYIHGEHAHKDRSHHYVTDGREKYIWYSQTGEEQYFDIANDPREEANLAADPQQAGRIAHWRGILARELDGREEGYSDGEKLIVGCTPQTGLQAIIG
jgi:arylsulfatase A-like enzyme